MAYSKDGSRLLVSRTDGHLIVLDAKSLGSYAREVTLPGSTCCLSASHGTTAALLTGRRKLRRGESVTYDGWSLVDWAGGRVLRSGPVDPTTTTLALSPDGTYLALGANRSVQVLDTQTGRAVSAARAEHRDGVVSLSWSPDSHTLLSGGYDGAVALWDPRTGKLLEKIDVASPADAVYPTYQSDGRILVPGGNGEVYLWDPSLRHAEAFACRLAGRDLTEDEWRQAFGTRGFRAVCTG